MGTTTELISQAGILAGNTSISTTAALAALNIFLDAEYRRKYNWQRLTVSISFAAAAVSNTADWDTKLIDVFEADDGSCGRYAQSDGTIVKLYALDYRQYISLNDRNTRTGPPERIVADIVGATFYVYPKTDAAYTVTLDYYQKPAALTAGQTPLWSSYAPDAILVQYLKCWHLEHMQDDREQQEKIALYGDERQGKPGMLEEYRRRAFAKQGITHQTALDQRRFLVAGDD